MAEAEIVQSFELLLRGWNTGSDIQLDHGSRPTGSLLFGETLGVGHLPAILAIIDTVGHFSTLTSCGTWDQGGEFWLSRLCAKVALEPCVEAGEVDGCCGEEVLEASFGVSNITAAAQSEAPNAL